MTAEEAKTALLTRCKVYSGGIEYEYVYSIIYRRGDDGKIKVYLELWDKCGHSLTETKMEEVELTR